MQQEIRIATLNALNLAPAGARLYDNLEPASAAETEAKMAWLARQLDLMQADVVAVQEVFSQEMLAEVLRRTEHFQQAVHLGSDPDRSAARYTPSVAMLSRLPLASAATALHFPPGLAPAGAPGNFARAPLHAAIELAPGCVADVIAIHLKSRRPDYRNGDEDSDPIQFGMARMRSLSWRALEATALRCHVHQLIRTHQRPCIVVGDFNDAVDAVTTEIVIGFGADPDTRLFDAASLATNRPQNAFTLMHEGMRSTIDHILVSTHLNGGVAAVKEIHYFNQHLDGEEAGASDHGQVLARLQLFNAESG